MPKIPIAVPDISEEETVNVLEAIRSGWISSKGPYVKQFESEFARYIGVNQGIATANGTVALHLAIVALGIREGDEVIVPTLSFIAAANAVTYAGAKVIFADSHPDYWCIDPKDVERKISKNTKAVIAVHLYGHPCDMDSILASSKERGLKVIEDCAEAHGAEYKGKKVGSFGDVSCFSFYGNKTITTGEGGMCLTNDIDLAERMRILRDHGMSPRRRYWYDVVGFNYRMTNIQAAIGVAQMKKVDKLIERKRQIADIYQHVLAGTEHLTLAPAMPWARSSYWFYSVLVKTEGIREKIINYLDNEGIETRPFFPPIHSLPPYSKDDTEHFPISEQLSSRGINLPGGPILSDDHVQEVAYTLLKGLSSF
jgi:perosamine synthetase